MKKSTLTENEITKRKQAQRQTRAIFAIDNLKPNPETQHIFDNFTTGKIATVEQAIQELDKHYNVKR